MPNIIPIRDLKNTAKISELCHRTNEPVFITKNGYGDMVLMSMETYEKNMLMMDVYAKIAQAEKEIEEGKTVDAKAVFSELRKKYNV
ncbi:MAG: type II toxin-antitoxin system Phd/YefM family antitoxin [Firmicutes bacterium]|nr:type II toxin-antitoxin system Phd/YefM family antitoxin [Bacillota bacterium]